MKKNFFKIIFLLIPLFINSCNNITGPLIQINLLQSPSFEENDQPSLKGWIGDTSVINFSNDVPPEGGKWSIFIYGNNSLTLRPIRPDQIIQKVKLLKGTYIYTFSFWAKADSINGSFAILGTIKNDTSRLDKNLEITKPTWTNYTIVDTLSYANYDSVEVFFGAGYSFQGVQGKIFFDLCSLTAK